MTVVNDGFDPRAGLPSVDRPGGRGCAIIVGIGLALAASVLHGFVPRFIQILENVDVPMPVPTVCLFTAARFVETFWPIWMAATLLPMWMWKRRVSSAPMAAGLLAGLTLFCVWTIYALLVPFTKLLQPIGGAY